MSITNIKPTAENVTLFRDWQRSTPADFALQENPVLYGGDRDWRISTNTNIFSEITGDAACTDAVIDVFVLDTCLFFWFTEKNLGIEHKFPDVILHAKLGDSLYLQIKTDKQSEIMNEVWLTPSKEENGAVLVHDDLLQHFHSGSRSLRLQSIFDSITKCSSLHFDPDSDGETHEENSAKKTDDDYIMVEHHNELEVVNEGQADDICDTDEEALSDPVVMCSSTAVLLDNKRQRHEYDAEDEKESSGNSAQSKRR